MVSTSAVNESTACQKMLSVNDNGLFQTDVAVSDEFSTWSIAVTSCASQNGKHSADQCRTVHVEPPGEPVGDGCLPAASRVVPTGHDHPDKSHYAVRVDFRRCFEHRQSGGDKPRVVKVRRTRRQAVWRLAPVSSSAVTSPLSSFVTPSLFHYRFETHLFHRCFSPWTLFLFQD